MPLHRVNKQYIVLQNASLEFRFVVFFLRKIEKWQENEKRLRRRTQKNTIAAANRTK